MRLLTAVLLSALTALLAMMVDAPSIRDVIAFPEDAACPVPAHTGPVARCMKSSLRELHIKLRREVKKEEPAA